MTLVDIFIIYSATFSNVFLLGFQSKNVHKSRYFLAFLTSIGITLAQYFFVRYGANEQNGMLFLVIAGLGGGMGIVFAIYLHDVMEGEKQFPWKKAEVSHE